ncbi:hypothetical protein [Streptomyces sp. NPDC056682]|uniref:hypothetical protein n=1 Tax=Streptomyces sp. NPDC056682 TaxID=3345909 RepID=UPI0036A1131F
MVFSRDGSKFVHAHFWGEGLNDPAALGSRACAELLCQGARDIIEARRRGERGYRVDLMAGGGLMTRHVPILRAHGLNTFHIGTSVRHGGRDTPIDRAAVRRWRKLIETDPGQPDRDDL